VRATICDSKVLEVIAGVGVLERIPSAFLSSSGFPVFRTRDFKPINPLTDRGIVRPSAVGDVKDLPDKFPTNLTMPYPLGLGIWTDRISNMHRQPEPNLRGR
jgi:hypothetical protein